MLTIEAWSESNDWRIDEKEQQRLERIERIRLNVDQIRSDVSNWIQDDLGEKLYRTELVMDLTQKISKKILQYLTEKYPWYKILIQIFLSDVLPQRTLFVSYRFDQQRDLCLTIKENNGHIYCSAVIVLLSSCVSAEDRKLE